MAEQIVADIIPKSYLEGVGLMQQGLRLLAEGCEMTGINLDINLNVNGSNILQRDDPASGTDRPGADDPGGR